jgi:hypothetical protein
MGFGILILPISRTDVKVSLSGFSVKVDRWILRGAVGKLRPEFSIMKFSSGDGNFPGPPLFEARDFPESHNQDGSTPFKAEFGLIRVLDL